MKPYIITFERRYDRPNVTYNIHAKDRDDAIDFVKRTHRVDFKRVVSCKQDKAPQLTIPHITSRDEGLGLSAPTKQAARAVAKLLLSSSLQGGPVIKSITRE
jgi:hypothetical protein